jgi:hypothetical protein
MSTPGIRNGLNASLTGFFEARNIIHFTALGSHSRVVATGLAHVGCEVAASYLTRLLALAI